MGFEFLETVTRQAAQRDPRVSISYARMRRADAKKHGDTPPCLLIGGPISISQQLGFKKKDERPWALLIDKVGRKGRICPHDKGTGRSVVLKWSTGFRFGFCPWLGTDAAAKEFVAWRIVDHPVGKTTVKALEFDLPAWFNGD